MNLAGFLDPSSTGQDSVGGGGRKIGEVGERDLVDAFSDKCGNI